MQSECQLFPLAECYDVYLNVSFICGSQPVQGDMYEYHVLLIHYFHQDDSRAG